MTAVLALPSMAQTHKAAESPAKEQGKMERGDRFADIPNLTDAQREGLKAIHQETRKANEPRREEMKAIRDKMNAAKASENPNQAELNLLIDKMHGVKAEMEKTRVAGELKAMSILTPEQQTAFRAKAKERGQRWEKSRNSEHRMKMERHRGHMPPVDEK